MKVKKILLLVEGTRSLDRLLLKGIGNYSRLFGPWSFYNGSHNPIFSETKANIQNTIKQLESCKPDGIITRYPEISSKFTQQGIPTIVAVYKTNPVSNETPVIVLDHEKISNHAAEHLLDCGFEHFAYFGYDDREWSDIRYQAFKKNVEVESKGVHYFGKPLMCTRNSWFEVQGQLVEWLKSLPKPVGVMACNDDCGLQLIDACKIAELRVPDEVAILGVDNDRLECDLADPPLSSVSTNYTKAGYDAAALLDRIMAGTEKMSSQQIVVEPLGVEKRRSTDIFALDDELVVLALRYIQKNSGRIIQVQDVADFVGVSRRSLEYRFKQSVKKTIYKCIRQYRIEYVSQLLLETDMSLLEISLRIGFTEPHNLSRQFKDEKGISPEMYRKQNLF